MGSKKGKRGERKRVLTAPPYTHLRVLPDHTPSLVGQTVQVVRSAEANFAYRGLRVLDRDDSFFFLHCV